MGIRSDQKISDLCIESLEPLILMSASIEGSDASEWIAGTSGDDSISADGGNDEIYASQGRNFIDGGRGIDTLVVYEGAQSDFEVQVQRNGSVLIEGVGLDGVRMSNTLLNVEQIAFTDGILQTAELERPNSAPIANADSYILGETAILIGNVLENDVDPDGESLTAVISKQPSFGLLKMGPNGGFVYLRTAGMQLSDSFEYTVTDRNGTTAVQQVEILGNESNSTPDTSNPTNPGSLPDISEIPIPEIQEPQQNLNPYSVDDSYQVELGESLFGNVSLNDGDVDGPAHQLVFELIDDAQHGNLNFYTDGSFDYWANETTENIDSFQYAVRDQEGGVSYASVNLGLPDPLPVPVPPTDNGDNTDETEDGTDDGTDDGTPVVDIEDTTPTIVTTSTTGISEGNLIVSNDQQTQSDLNIVEYSTAQSGTVSIDDAGKFSYQADTGFTGIDYFHYIVSDGENTDRTTVVIHVGTDSQQIIQGQEFISVMPGVATPIVIDLNHDGAITVTGETTARDKSSISGIGATVQFDIEGDGIVDSIEWVDGSGDGILIDTSKFTGTNIDGKALFGDEGGRYSNGYQKLSQLDGDGNTLLEDAELSSLALWIDDGDGVLQLEEISTLQDFGIFSISTVMQLSDEGLMRSWAYTDDDFRLLTEDVWFAKEDGVGEPPAENNTAPDADPDVFVGEKNSVITGNVLSNDHDYDGDSLSLLRHTRPIHGTVTLGNDGAFRYVPDPDFVGVDYFQYEVSDGKGGTDTAVAMLTVKGDTTVVGQPAGNTITGTIWEDSDRNGLLDNGEAGRGTSVFVSLVDSEGRVIESVHTNGNGVYSFDGVTEGSYRIRVAEESLPGFQSFKASVTLRDVNSNFFDAIDSDISRITGESSLLRFDAVESQVHTITIDAGYFYR